MAWMQGRERFRYGLGYELGNTMATLINQWSDSRNRAAFERELEGFDRADAMSGETDPEDYAAGLAAVYGRYRQPLDDRFKYAVAARASKYDRRMRERQADLIPELFGEPDEGDYLLPGGTTLQRRDFAPEEIPLEEPLVGGPGPFDSLTYERPSEWYEAEGVVPLSSLPQAGERYVRDVGENERLGRGFAGLVRSGAVPIKEVLGYTQGLRKDRTSEQNAALATERANLANERMIGVAQVSDQRARDLAEKTDARVRELAAQSADLKTRLAESEATRKREQDEANRRLKEDLAANAENLKRELSGAKAAGPDSPLGKLLADRNALPKGHPDRKTYDRAIERAAAGSGLRVEVDKDGKVSVSEGSFADPGLSKTTRNAVEKSALEAGETLQRMTKLERDFDAGLQQIGPRMRSAWAGLKAKVSGRQALTKEEQDLKKRVTVQRRRAYDILNNELNRLSGAAVSEHEMARLTKGLPNPGTGVFDGDDPVDFEEKFRDSLGAIRAAVARLAYIRRNGLTLGDVALDDMPELMNRRGREIEAELVKRGVPKQQATKQARNRLAEEFGLLPGKR